MPAGEEQRQQSYSHKNKTFHGLIWHYLYLFDILDNM